MQIESKVLDHCWVCGLRFTDVVPPGPASREEHHLVPQAYGGTDGPTVSLCANHHSALHTIAVHMKSGKPYYEIIGGHDTIQQAKLLKLAEIVYNSEQATRNDPNKKVLVSLTLTKQQDLMIQRLKKVYPQAKGRADILQLALQALYVRNFIGK